jgi:hypothetical protein
VGRVLRGGVGVVVQEELAATLVQRAVERAVLGAGSGGAGPAAGGVDGGGAEDQAEGGAGVLVRVELQGLRVVPAAAAAASGGGGRGKLTPSAEFREDDEGVRVRGRGAFVIAGVGSSKGRRNSKLRRKGREGWEDPSAINTIWKTDSYGLQTLQTSTRGVGGDWEEIGTCIAYLRAVEKSPRV